MCGHPMASPKVGIMWSLVMNRVIETETPNESNVWKLGRGIHFPVDYGKLGNVVSYPSKVRGGDPSENDFIVFNARRSYASAVLGVVILSLRSSVCPSVICVFCDKNKTMHCRYFDTIRKSNHSTFPTPTAVGGRRPLPSEICAQNDPPPFEKRRIRQISTYNVSTVKDNEKS